MQLDLVNRIYTVEILHTPTDIDALLEIIESANFISSARKSSFISDDVKTYRYDFIHTERFYRPANSELFNKLPFFKGGYYHYDFIVCFKGDMVLFACPYTQLAIELFSNIDIALSKYQSGVENYSYTKINITQLLILAGENAALTLPDNKDGNASSSYQITDCTLKYNFAEGSQISKQTIKIAGDNLAHSNQYKELVSPILDKKLSGNVFDIEPLSMSFNYRSDSQRKCSCFTDRYGNFRIRVGKKVDPFIYLINAIYRLNDPNVGIGDQTPNLPAKSLLEDE